MYVSPRVTYTGTDKEIGLADNHINIAKISA